MLIGHDVKTNEMLEEIEYEFDSLRMIIICLMLTIINKTLSFLTISFFQTIQFIFVFNRFTRDQNLISINSHYTSGISFHFSDNSKKMIILHQITTKIDLIYIDDFCIFFFLLTSIDTKAKRYEKNIEIC